ncbi:MULTISPECIES: hypothetical protein [Pseudomonas]|uniref:hypothetical protein n=1 Tax=Pseudomonas TaxID=286 RepID=UPI0008763FB0|nr:MULTISPECIES: hypothetical protein [Pseudomonas]MDB6444508.1 hypothetical protein [Pseudomonas sp. 21TX0197]NHN67800.1 hypothetical protein [Pseudomonas fluorescens]SCX67857.1 hypothetical protein SAMN03159507_03596 [Pseudomonas sp. NFACC32-1]SFW74799.1 hypothetical protein SAMN03159376_03391 [Pseudomonas sp. NFACC09-4]SFX79973.1 hypothetical protein SAMN03159442_02905 [Pseudomonas sp. NFACC47-1]
MDAFTTPIQPATPRNLAPHEPLGGADDLKVGLFQPRYRVVLAGKCFFHIEETSTGRVRGFRADHNEACYLARHLEQSA